MTHCDFIPELINYEGNVVRIEFGYIPTEVELPTMGNGDSEKKTEYVGYTVRVEQPLNYGKIVSAIVREKYSADEVEAIVLNHGTNSSDNDAEYAELQEWRKYAKEIAHQVVG